MGPSSSAGLRIAPRWPSVKMVFLLFKEGLEKKPTGRHGQGANNISTNIISTATCTINIFTNSTRNISTNISITTISTSCWSSWKDTLLGRVLHPHQVVFVRHLLVLTTRRYVSLHSNT